MPQDRSRHICRRWQRTREWPLCIFWYASTLVLDLGVGQLGVLKSIEDEISIL